MIFNEESLGKNSLGKRKVYAYYVFLVNTSKHPQHQYITFTSEDGEGMSYPHDDPIVIMIDVDLFIVKKILINGRSSCNVLT